ncbi:NAD-dependent epimerase/dehydratase family protein [Chamaesiphon polymorphus]|uniref:3-beta hydroxysteroid dehydrogenase n=1 Tax=Chamaesiphon polymorphus CCALA 037 TaxID=2107692 RepID=A0A2T1FYK3_9CYAN|nr:NAD(P)-dependent oxidoreductase [Chamaesiphon polymorphus]PSB50077.1 3-beta hydroxysteroid dehydrogenase [Chamaesiphon polymorphus CCALA 037]
MRSLITGATGFLGKQLVVKLSQLGHEVTALGRNSTIGDRLVTENVRFVSRDLRDREGIIADLQGQDYVFHCGALSSPWGKERDFYEINYLGTKNVIEGCQIHRIKRLIHVSTSAVYCDYRDRLNILEDTPLPIPVNAYTRSKQLAELEVSKAYQAGVPTITIRPRGIFGPGDTAILPRLMRANRRVGIPFIDRGRACIDITYIDNVIDALLLCQTAPDTALGKIFNITNGEPITVANLLTKLFTKLDEPCRLRPISLRAANWTASLMELIANTILLGKEPILTRYTVGLLAYSQTLDITAATHELGYQPRVSIDSGLDIFARWYQTHTNPGC